jgi:uncharacterized protein (DUF302 family)
MKKLIPLCLALSIFSTSGLANEPISATDAPIVVYQVEEAYDEIKSNLEMAITGQGMLITSTLHISEMLERTAADTGLGKPLYEKAEALEFCSIKMSYQMSEAHPANMATCPLTLSVYQVAGDSDNTYVAYRRPSMLGEADAVEKALLKLLDGIVREAIE